MTGIGLYISYRPDDKGFVARMSLHLQELVPALEIKQSNPRVDVASIDSIIKEMDDVLVVVGANWLRANSQSVSILNSPDDYVRRELIAALKYPHIRIAPVLVNDVRMPRKQDLPFELAAFASIKAATVKDDSFETDLLQIAEMLRSTGNESSWFPSVEYGIIQIRSKKGGFVKRYIETDYTPVIVMIDREEVGTMQLVNNTFEQKVIPGEHVVALKPGDKPGRQCECRVLIRQGQTSVLYAERGSFWGMLSLKPAD